MRELKKVIKEDEMDEQKHATLGEIDSLVSTLKGKVQKLVELDAQGTGTGDLTDQIVTFEKAIMALQGVSARSHKIVPENVEEAVGDSADPILDLIEELGSHSIVLDELIRYLDGDTIKDFVSDFRRHNDMPPMKEAEIELEPGYTIKTDRPGELKGTKTSTGYVGGKGGEAMYKANRILDKIEEEDPATDEQVKELFIKYAGGEDKAVKTKVMKTLRELGWFGGTDESVTEAEGRRVIEVNKNIDLAGDSIWQGEKRGEEVTYKIYVHDITINTDEDGYMSVSVKHEGPWTIYTDSGFEEEISGIIGTPVSFSEQGMQDDGMAHLEGEEETKQESRMMEELDRILKIAGVQKAPVAEETLEEKCGCDDPKCDDPSVHEDEKVDEGEMPKGLKDYHDKKKKKSDDKEETDESIDEAKKEIDEEPNEGNEFSGELEKARKAGKDEFEVDGKKYKVKKESAETDEEVVAEAPTMDTTQLINLLKNSGLSEEAINKKLDEWANTPAGVGETEPTKHAGDANDDFAQAVNLSLKRYLDAQDLKINVNENHSVKGMKAKYNAHKDK